MRKGKIIKLVSGVYTVKLDNEIIETKPLGVFRFNGVDPLVGDDCLVNEKNQIEEILDRKNELTRPRISNVDKVIITTSLIRPDLNLNLLDRLISQVEWVNINIVLAFTKADLVDITDFSDIINYYKSLGYHTYIIPQEMDGLANEIKDSICVLSGQSGVGKSKIVNRLDPSLHLKEDDISEALNRGKHTTRYTELYSVRDGFIADTPGFGSLDLEMDEVSLMQTFREFFPSKCKYNPCLHLNEPGCEVKDKLNNNLILKSRYENYLCFIEEIRKNKDKMLILNKKKRGK